ncbi:MAG: helix-turn-helix transcriptional regulator [Pseudobdellovibrionaceae bacterium]
MKTAKSVVHMGRKLQELRLGKGLSMRETAKRIGVPETTYREWEYGRAIRGEPYIQIAKVFGITLQELFEHKPDLEQNLEFQIDKIISDLISLRTHILKVSK